MSLQTTASEIYHGIQRDYLKGDLTVDWDTAAALKARLFLGTNADGATSSNTNPDFSASQIYGTNAPWLAANEIDNGTGYSAGGYAAGDGSADASRSLANISFAITGTTSSVLTVDCDDITWSSATWTLCRGVGIYLATGLRMISWHNFGEEAIAGGGAFVVATTANGIFQNTSV